MLRKSLFVLFAAVLFSWQIAGDAHAAGPKIPAGTLNYVDFYLLGDCNQEDCIAAVKDALSEDQPQIVWMRLDVLAPHQTIEYKIVKISFKDLKKAPFADVMEKIAGLGYNVKSYVIHDTSKGKDVIIPH